ncbi:hypothetical protein NE237_004189 [Protea cynaroides]|uniref:Uncharacterized protein n=1 Tax=Protea cynaroides TaxID=273540 RepID=A0A9Q0KIH1_9MAGN|nr:hypothetical protein NE237_004189 [Protea cynaroides]
MAMIPCDTSGIPIVGVPFGSSSSSTRDTTVTPSSVPMKLSKTSMTRDPNGLVSLLLVNSMNIVQPDLSLMQRIPMVVGGGGFQQGGALMVTDMRKIRESKFTGCRNKSRMQGKKHRSGAPVFLIHSVLTGCIPYLDFNDLITNLDIPIDKFNSDGKF